MGLTFNRIISSKMARITNNSYPVYLSLIYLSISGGRRYFYMWSNIIIHVFINTDLLALSQS